MSGAANVGAPARTATGPSLPWTTRAAILVRMLGIQGVWSYETMLGNGMAFAMEPALRRLPGGRGGEAYRAAMVRHSGYFNAHPYLAAIAVGALIRAELDGVPAAQIERFRVAAPGPLGSVGDRLVWAGWLPLCSSIALLGFGLGLSPTGVLALFLVSYNAGHLGLRIWGLHAGFREGLRMAQALANPVLRNGPPHVARATALVAGVALPVAAQAILGEGRVLLGGVLIAVTVGALLLTRLAGKLEGWRVAIYVLAAFILYSVVR